MQRKQLGCTLSRREIHLPSPLTAITALQSTFELIKKNNNDAPHAIFGLVRSISGLAVSTFPFSDYHSGAESFTLNTRHVCSKPAAVNDFCLKDKGSILQWYKVLLEILGPTFISFLVLNK